MTKPGCRNALSFCRLAKISPCVAPWSISHAACWVDGTPQPGADIAGKVDRPGTFFRNARTSGSPIARVPRLVSKPLAKLFNALAASAPEASARVSDKPHSSRLERIKGWDVIVRVSYRRTARVTSRAVNPGCSHSAAQVLRAIYKANRHFLGAHGMAIGRR